MKRPGGVFLHDSLDVENPERERHTPVHTAQWRITLIYAISGFLLLLLFAGLIAWGHYLTGLVGIWVQIGWIILVFTYGPLLVLILGIAGTGVIYLYNKAQRAGLINLMEHQAHLDTMRNVSDQYFDIAGRRMDRSLFQGVQNLTYGHTLSNTAREYREDTIDVLPDIIEDTLPPLEQMKKEGLIARSGNSILLGFEEE